MSEFFTFQICELQNFTSNFINFAMGVQKMILKKNITWEFGRFGEVFVCNFDGLQNPILLQLRLVVLDAVQEVIVMMIWFLRGLKHTILNTVTHIWDFAKKNSLFFTFAILIIKVNFKSNQVYLFIFILRRKILMYSEFDSWKWPDEWIIDLRC